MSIIINTILNFQELINTNINILTDYISIILLIFKILLFQIIDSNNLIKNIEKFLFIKNSKIYIFNNYLIFIKNDNNN